MANNSYDWQHFLNLIEGQIEPQRFKAIFMQLQEELEYSPDELVITYAGIIVEFGVVLAGLAAALLPPADQAPEALAEVRERLKNLDFASPQEELDEEFGQYYEDFITFAQPAFAHIGEVMESVFRIYLNEAYDPHADPDELIYAALEMAWEDLPAAQEQISRAGAISLHGQPLWWRWEEEAYGPAHPWLMTVYILSRVHTASWTQPLGPLEEAREMARALFQQEDERLEEEPETPEEPPQPEPVSPEDRLFEQLIELGKSPLTEEVRELTHQYRDEAVEILIAVARDEELWPEEAPGEGFAPIHAIQLLGELRDPRAIPTLIEVLNDADPIHIIYDKAIFALEAMGELAREPVLKCLRYSTDVELKTTLAASADKFVEPGDEEAYELIQQVWEEATWDDAKVLLAYPLIHIGGERAIPLLEAALENPELDRFDYNEIVAVLKDWNIDVSKEYPLGPSLVRRAQYVLGGITDPERLYDFIVEFLEDEPETPAYAAYLYTQRIENIVILYLTNAILLLSPQESVDVLSDVITQLEGMTFEPDVDHLPQELQEAYYALANEYGPASFECIAGFLHPLHFYFEGSFDVAQSPDPLVAEARRMVPDEREKALEHFAQAGALALAGRDMWPVWEYETSPPLSYWMEGFLESYHLLQQAEHIPPTQVESSGVRMPISAYRITSVDPPPSVKPLFELLLEREEDRLTRAERRRFAEQREEVIPYLLEIASEPEYSYVAGPGKGWAAVLAVRLLGDLEVREAADILVKAIRDSKTRHVIYDAAIFSLIALGPAGAEATRTYMRYGQDLQTKIALSEVLGYTGTKDSQDFRLLQEVWEEANWADGLRTVALAFGGLGDERAIPLLEEAFKDARSDALDRDCVWLALQELGTSPKAPLPTLFPHLNAPPSSPPRLIYDPDTDRPQRLRYTPWGFAICPDCGELIRATEDGFVHLAPHSPDRKKGKKRK